MSLTEIAVTAAGIVSIGFLACFFFGPKKARQAELVGQVQVVRLTVNGGYSLAPRVGTRGTETRI